MLTLLLISLAAAAGEAGVPPTSRASWAANLSFRPQSQSWFLRPAPAEAAAPRRTGGVTIVCGIPVRKADPGFDAAIERKAPAGLDPRIAREAPCRK